MILTWYVAVALIMFIAIGGFYFYDLATLIRDSIKGPIRLSIARYNIYSDIKAEYISNAILSYGAIYGISLLLENPFHIFSTLSLILTSILFIIITLFYILDGVLIYSGYRRLQR